MYCVMALSDECLHHYIPQTFPDLNYLQYKILLCLNLSEMCVLIFSINVEKKGKSYDN